MARNKPRRLRHINEHIGAILLRQCSDLFHGRNKTAHITRMAHDQEIGLMFLKLMLNGSEVIT